MDQIEELLTSKAATASGLQNAQPSAAVKDAAKSLCNVLSAIADPALNAQSSLSRGLSAIAAKRRMKGDKIAKGLQQVIASDHSGINNTRYFDGHLQVSTLALVEVVYMVDKDVTYFHCLVAVPNAKRLHDLQIVAITMEMYVGSYLIHVRTDLLTDTSAKQ